MTFNIKKIFHAPVLILFLTLLYSCHKEEEHIPPTVYATDENIILNDVPYGSDPKQRMNVYLPQGRSTSSTKFIVLIHGGAWSLGDKDEFGLLDENAFAILRSQFPDFAFFNLNYRLVEGAKNQYPAAENDIKSAMDHIYDNLNSYQISSHTYLLGASAGAHLAALYVLKNNHTRLKGCIALAGPYNLVSLYKASDALAKTHIADFLGGTPNQVPDQYEKASPVNFITPNSPKFLIVHGTQDELVPISQAIEFKNALESKNVPTTYLTYPGGHEEVPPESLLVAFLYFKAFLK